MKITWKNIILLPLSVIYQLITSIRNWLYDSGILPSKNFKMPVISVGNLAVGGTGKTPHVEYILDVLKQEHKIAVLSRGYKRKTKGFILADQNSTSNSIGDEPYQIWSKNPDITVAVDEKRAHGISKLLNIDPKLDVFILDDAMQHRQVQVGLSILLTDYSNLYIYDSHLPGGNLRESKSGCNRADIIVVTKCPDIFSPIEVRIIKNNLNIKPHQALFFSAFEYQELKAVFPENQNELYSFKKIKEEQADVLIVAGIVSPQGMVDYVEKQTTNVHSLFFPDHHNFQRNDLKAIETKFEKISNTNKIIIVTEKDAARIASINNFPESLKAYLYQLPIKVKILNNQYQLFIDKIKHYVAEDSRNS